MIHFNVFIVRGTEQIWEATKKVIFLKASPKVLPPSTLDINGFPPSRFNISIAPARLHTYGVKFRKNKERGRPRNQMDLAIGHKYQQWREDSFSEQLHLGDIKRWQMGRTILTYSLFHIKGIFGATIVFYFSVHYQSITKHRWPPMGTFYMKHALLQGTLRGV